MKNTFLAALLSTSSVMAYAPERMPVPICSADPVYRFAQDITRKIIASTFIPQASTQNTHYYAFRDFSIDSELEKARAVSPEEFKETHAYFTCLRRALPWLPTEFDVMTTDRGKDYFQNGSLEEIRFRVGNRITVFEFEHHPQ